MACTRLLISECIYTILSIGVFASHFFLTSKEYYIKKNIVFHTLKYNMCVVKICVLSVLEKRLSKNC